MNRTANRQRNVLIVAPVFVPISYPPALRLRQFAMHLGEFGWTPRVVTHTVESYEWPPDSELAGMLPPDLDVKRVGSIPVDVGHKIGVNDIGIRGFFHQARELIRECLTRKPDAVLVSAPPFYPLLLARLTHLLFRVPYVVDFQDPWIPPERTLRVAWQQSWKRALSLLLAHVLEPLAIGRASHLVGVSRGVTDSVIERYARFDEGDATEIAFGGEVQEFDHARAHPYPNPVFDPSDGCVHVAYVGVLIPEMASPLRAVLRGVRLGLDSDPAFSRLRLHFVGTSYASQGRSAVDIMGYAEEFGVATLVEERPRRLLYLDAVRTMTAADGILLLGPDAAYYAASKVYPSILSRRPLLAVLHEDCTPVRVLEKTRAGMVITFGPSRSAESHAEIARDWFSGLLHAPDSVQPHTDWGAFEAHTARAMAGRLAGVLDRAIEEPGSSRR